MQARDGQKEVCWSPGFQNVLTVALAERLPNPNPCVFTEAMPGPSLASPPPQECAANTCPCWNVTCRDPLCACALIDPSAVPRFGFCERRCSGQAVSLMFVGLPGSLVAQCLWSSGGPGAGWVARGLAEGVCCLGWGGAVPGAPVYSGLPSVETAVAGIAQSCGKGGPSWERLQGRLRLLWGPLPGPRLHPKLGGGTCARVSFSPCPSSWC